GWALDAASDRLMLWVSDRFGRMTIAPVVRAVGSLGGKAVVDSSGGGAGLGLRRLLEASDLVAWRVRRGKLCEVLAAIDLNGKRRRVGTAKTIFFHELP